MTKVVKLRLLRTELVRQTDRYSTYVVSPVAHVAPGWQCRRRRNPINSLFLCLFPSDGDSRSVRSSVGRSVGRQPSMAAAADKTRESPRAGKDL